jgi:hypothetical protein
VRWWLGLGKCVARQLQRTTGKSLGWLVSSRIKRRDGLAAAAMEGSGGAHWEMEMAAHASGGLRALNRRLSACFAAKEPTESPLWYGGGLGRCACTGGGSGRTGRYTAARPTCEGGTTHGRRGRPTGTANELTGAGPPRPTCTAVERRGARSRSATWPARRRDTTSIYFNWPCLKAKYSKICN